MPAMASAQTLDLIVRRCNNLHALVADTVGRASRNNLLVIAAVAPVLFPGAVLPLDYPHANPPPANLAWLLFQNLFLNGCLASAARQAVGSKPGSGGQAANPSGLSTSSSCGQAVCPRRARVRTPLPNPPFRALAGQFQ